MSGEWRHKAYTFPCCGGRRWVEDENWQGDGRTERVHADGLIPCGACNFAGWQTPENEPAEPWCVDCEQPWPCDAETERNARLTAEGERDALAAIVRGFAWDDSTDDLGCYCEGSAASEDGNHDEGCRETRAVLTGTKE